MAHSLRKSRGFTLIELLVVLVIVGILAIVGVFMIGDRPGASVHAVMDELEGVIANAHKRAASTGADVTITTQGEWDPANPLSLVYTGASPSETFRLATTTGPNPGLQRVHMHSAVVTAAQAGWWGTAGGTTQDITAIPPFAAGGGPATGFEGILTTGALNLFQGGAATGTVIISGANKRFTTTFWVEVVGLRNGQPVVNGPRGLLVGLANGGTIYKFYNPGTLSGGNGRWRRL